MKENLRYIIRGKSKKLLYLTVYECFLLGHLLSRDRWQVLVCSVTTNFPCTENKPIVYPDRPSLFCFNCDVTSVLSPSIFALTTELCILTEWWFYSYLNRKFISYIWVKFISKFHLLYKLKTNHHLLFQRWSIVTWSHYIDREHIYTSQN
jgi:hypothetical protein